MEGRTLRDLDSLGGPKWGEMKGFQGISLEFTRISGRKIGLNQENVECPWNRERNGPIESAEIRKC